MKVRTRLSVSFGVVFLSGAFPFALEAVFVKDPVLLGAGGALASALVLLGFFGLGRRFERRLWGASAAPQPPSLPAADQTETATIAAYGGTPEVVQAMETAHAMEETTGFAQGAEISAGRGGYPVSGGPAAPGIAWRLLPGAGRLEAASAALEETYNVFARLIQGAIAGNRSIAAGMAEQKKAVENASASIESRMKSIDLISASIEEQSAAVSQLSGTIEQMTASIRNVATVGVKAGEIAETLSQRAESGGSAVSTAMDSIRNVHGFSEQIAEIVTMITDIANQTNLLSMNAAIEAAHAGDAGRGFAVVASEIRKLAKNAEESAKQIARLVKSVVRTINEASETGLQAMSRFTEIRDDVRQTRTVVAEISGATTEQSKGADEILKAATSLVAVSEQVRNAVTEQRSTTREAGRIVSDLKEISERAGVIAGAADMNRFPMLDALSRLGRVSTQTWDIARESGSQSSRTAHK